MKEDLPERITKDAERLGASIEKYISDGKGI
jgi:hypothetical protein